MTSIRVGRSAGNGIGDRQFAKAIEVRAAVGLKVSRRVGHDDPQHAARFEHTQAVAQKIRQLFAGVQVLDELLRPDARGAAVSQRQRSAAVPSDARRRSQQIHVDEAVENLRAARHVHQRAAQRPHVRQHLAAAGQHEVLALDQPRVPLEPKLVEHRPRDGQMRKQPAPELLLDGQAGDSAASGIR